MTSTTPSDSDTFDIVSKIFGMSRDEAESRMLKIADRLPHRDSPDAQDMPEQRLQELRPILDACGIPSDPDHHQQPHEFMKLWQSALHPDQSAFDGEFERTDIEINNVLYILLLEEIINWIEVLQSAGYAPIDILKEVLQQAFIQACKLNLNLLGCACAVTMRSRAELALSTYTYFLCTRGLFDLKSGALLDRELAAQREYEMQILRMRRKR